MFFYLSLSRIDEADNPGPVQATAKLFGVAANLTATSRTSWRKQTNVQREFRERIPSLHLIGQSEHPRHSQPYGLSLSLPVSAEPGGDPGTHPTTQ